MSTKTASRLILFFLALMLNNAVTGQDDFIDLTSLQLIKGLDDREYLSRRLTENGFTKTGEKLYKYLRPGYQEYWNYKSLLYADKLNRQGKENNIILRIDESQKDFSDRLIESFPFKSEEKGNLGLHSVEITRINKEANFSLSHHRDSDIVYVYIWYDSPWYFFEYTNDKRYR